MDGAPHIVNARFAGIRGEVLVHFLEQKRIYIAWEPCSSKSKGRSHVLEALGLSSEEIPQLGPPQPFPGPNGGRN